MTEGKLQKEIIDYLKEIGAFPLKMHQPSVGIPEGFPDLLAFYKNSWIAIEVKASKDAPFRPLQEAQLKRLKKHNPDLVFVVYPENWRRVKSLIRKRLSLT